MTSPLILQLPEEWTPEQALSVYELLHELADAIWDRHEHALLELLAAKSREHDQLHLPLADFDDELPF